MATWLVCDSQIWRSPLLSESVFSALPRFFPKLGSKALVERLEDWLQNVDGLAAFAYPDQVHWTELQKIDPPILAAAVKELNERIPRHNPNVLLFLGALRVAAGDANGPSSMAEARANLEKRLPKGATGLYSNLIQSMSQSGVRDALPMLLELAQAEAEKAPSAMNKMGGSYSEFRALYTLESVLPVTPNHENRKDELQVLKTWLTSNLGTLIWEPERRRFRSDAPPPGFETIYASIRRLEEKFEVKLLKVANPNEEFQHALWRDLAELVGHNPTAASDPNLETLLLAMLKKWPNFTNEDRAARQQIEKANHALGLRLLTVYMRATLADDQNLYGIDEMWFNEAPEHRAVFATLKPEYAAGYRSRPEKAPNRRRFYRRRCVLF